MFFIQSISWWNPIKLHEKKAPKQGREKETKGKDQSPGKQIQFCKFLKY